MERVDVAVIGGGVLGAFVARNLCRWQLETLLIEAEKDVCMGITRANSAIVYAGYDNKPGSLKAAMTVAANAEFDTLCEQLSVPFQRVGSLMVSMDAKGEATLQKKYEQGKMNGVSSLKLLSAEEARTIEPMLTEKISTALWAPSTGTVNPWQLGIAAYENALENGCRSMLESRVCSIRQEKEGYIIETEHDLVCCRAIVNAAGLFAANVQEMVFPPSVRLTFDAADYLVFDRLMPSPKHIIFQEYSDGKGITAVPTVEGTLLLEAPGRTLTTDWWATSRDGLVALRQQAKSLFPDLSMTAVIRSFAAMRPNPYLINSLDTRLHDFVIAEPAEDFISLIGVKTPGLTCANVLGRYVADKLAKRLNASANVDFVEKRRVQLEKDGEIVCRCEGVTKGDIINAIARGARTVDGVKHRVGSGMGRCQGSRCRYTIATLLKEAGYEDL